MVWRQFHCIYVECKTVLRKCTILDLQPDFKPLSNSGTLDYNVCYRPQLLNFFFTDVVAPLPHSTHCDGSFPHGDGTTRKFTSQKAVFSAVASCSQGMIPDQLFPFHV